MTDRETRKDIETAKLKDRKKRGRQIDIKIDGGRECRHAVIQKHQWTDTHKIKSQLKDRQIDRQTDGLTFANLAPVNPFYPLVLIFLSVFYYPIFNKAWPFDKKKPICYSGYKT